MARKKTHKYKKNKKIKAPSQIKEVKIPVINVEQYPSFGKKQDSNEECSR